MLTVMTRTVTPSQLRDPEVLADAAMRPLVIFDAKRDTELMLGSRLAWETDQDLLKTYSMLLANAVVELPDDEPSAVALGLLGFAATWPKDQRLWLLRQLAEAYAASVRTASVEPVECLVAFFGRPEATVNSRIAAPVSYESLPSELRLKLTPRTA